MFRKTQYVILAVVVLWTGFVFLEPALLYTPLPCSFYNSTYLFFGMFFLVSSIIYLKTYKKNNSTINWIVPLFCILALLGIYFSYRFGLISVYEDIFRAVGKGPYESCEQFPIKFLIKNY